MSNFSIAEEFTLPSRGKVYSQNVNPVVKLRSMTTQDEMKRLAPAERVYKNICEIIDDCILEDIGISSYDMCLADYQFLLHRLRIVTYGTEYKVNTSCPYCGSESHSAIDLSELNVRYFNQEDSTKYREFTLPKTNKRIVIKMQTPRMMDDINTKSKELKKKSNNTAGDTAFLFSLQEIIDTVDGIKLDPIKKEDFVRALPMMDTNFILRHAQKLSESFGIDTKLDRVCPICGLDYTGSFRVNSEFFGPTIDI